MDERTTDNGPWHKLAGLRPVELMTQKLKYNVLGRVQNILEKGENAGYQHFLPLPKCFQQFPFWQS